MICIYIYIYIYLFFHIYIYVYVVYTYIYIVTNICIYIYWCMPRIRMATRSCISPFSSWNQFRIPRPCPQMHPCPIRARRLQALQAPRHHKTFLDPSCPTPTLMRGTNGLLVHGPTGAPWNHSPKAPPQIYLFWEKVSNSKSYF